MSETGYDLIIIGAGSGGLTAASFAAKLGARTAIVEKGRIGGDCTWTGCVPSKALLRAAKAAHEVRTASEYGIRTGPASTDMSGVRHYLEAAIREVYQYETPEKLESAGIDVVQAPARFLDSHTVQAGERTLRADAFLITTGARALTPPIPGLNQVPFLTYEQIFENETLPTTMAIIGAGPIGMELAQAYQRLGASVTLVGRKVLPKEENEAQVLMREIFEQEGVLFLDELASGVRHRGGKIIVETPAGDTHAELLLVATGRGPCVRGLDLEKAGVEYSSAGIAVDDRLRSNVKHIYAAGDVTGGRQFTHFAGWQAFQAVRNALLPGHTSGFTDIVPRVTYTDPEVAQVGLTEVQAKERLADAVEVHIRGMDQIDRAICENDTRGFLKVITRADDTILGATIVAARAGDVITEFVIAIHKKLHLSDLAGPIHPYPTYSTGVQQLATDRAVGRTLSGTRGKVIRGLSRLMR